MTFPVRHKFNAVRCEANGIKFASKKERKRYLELQQLQLDDNIQFFLRQVPFHLPGGVKYICDYLVFWKGGDVTIEDVKGMRTSMYIAKKKLVEATYLITITEI
jgi:hypothetical protein